MTTTTPRRSLPSLTRRLLKQAEVALKLGLSSDRFYRIRPALEQKGFPPPLQLADVSKWMKWDEKAIDLWLDKQMPDDLQQAASKDQVLDVDVSAIEAKLQQRAEGMAL